MRRHLKTHLQMRMLRAIVAIADQQSLLHASHELGITQPALTRTLRSVEDILGGRLFERHSRGVTLTRFGSIVCESARRILAEVDRLDDALELFQDGRTEVVSIGALAPAAVGVLPGFFATMRDRARNLHIRLVQGTFEELAPLLGSGQIALVLGRLFQPEVPDGFAREVLYLERTSILARAAHPILSSGEVTPDRLARYGFALPQMSHRVEEEYNALLSSLGARIEVRGAPLTFLRELLHGSDVLTISPPQSMGGDVARGSIRVVPYEMPGPARPAGLLTRQDGDRSRHDERVIALLRAYLIEWAPPAPAQGWTGIT